MWKRASSGADSTESDLGTLALPRATHLSNMRGRVGSGHEDSMSKCQSRDLATVPFHQGRTDDVVADGVL